LKVYLGDFGTSKLVSTNSVTSTSNNVGSIRWRAPETYGKNAKWSDKADIFSLGITYWEIAAREIPFQNLANEDVMSAIRIDQERPIIPKNWPTSFVHLIEWCWENDPSKRPTSQQVLQFMKEHDNEYVLKNVTITQPIPNASKFENKRMFGKARLIQF
jgi:serine/threonine-protein kinase CTR1